MKQKWKVLICILCSFAAICGCGGTAEINDAKTPEESEAEMRSELNTIRVAVQEYYLSSSIGYILDHGLDEQFGLKLEPVLYPSGAEQIQDVDRDVYDVATIGASFLYPLIENQAVLIGEHIRTTGGDAIYVRTDSPVLEVKGFNPIYPEVYGDPATAAGAVILMKENTTSQYLGMKWLESIGVKADAVQIEYMGFDEMYEAFSNGYGDAAVLAAPYSYQSGEEGYVEAASTDSLFINTYEVIIATNEAYEEKQDTLLAFLRLLLYANEQLETDIGTKLEACGAWYEKNGVAFTDDVLQKECMDKLFVTKENYSIEEFGEFEYKYAEYMAAIGNIPPIQLKNVKENMDSSLFEQALSGGK